MTRAVEGLIERFDVSLIRPVEMVVSVQAAAAAAAAGLEADENGIARGVGRDVFRSDDWIVRAAPRRSASERILDVIIALGSEGRSRAQRNGCLTASVVAAEGCYC